MAAAVPPNTNLANGLVPVGTISGGSYEGKLRRVCFLASDSTACGIYDPVKLVNNADTDGTTPAVTKAAAGDTFVGSLVALEPDLTDEGSLSSSNYRRASTLRYGFVTYGSDVLYSVQEDSVGSTLSATSCGLNADLIIGSINTSTGFSGAMVDSSTANTTNTLTVRLHSVDNRIGNKVGDYARWLVSINLNDDTSTTGVA